MNYKIFENGTQINTIVADENFVNHYCEEMGYTYEPTSEESSIPEVKPPSNELLEAQIQATSDRQEFLEDCIAEMATLLYS